MRWPETWQIVFALKTFSVAMLALYVAFAMDLPNPYWAMTTVFVVSQPFAGAMRSKALYRLSGTLVGGAAGITLYGMFGGEEFALMLALVGWVALCGYFSVNDRTPRSYFFLLAGLTALLIGWPGRPATTGPIFDVAVARVLEISLGILCAVMVDSIVFPRRIAPAFRTQIDTWFSDARELTLDVLNENRAALTGDRRKIAADAAQVGVMAVHLAYEGRRDARSARWAHVLQQRMLRLMPILSSINDRLAELRRDERPLPEPIEAAMVSMRDWVDARCPADRIAALKGELAHCRREPGGEADWRDILLISLVTRFEELVALVEDCQALRSQVEAPRRTVSQRLRKLADETVVAPHRDRALALWSILTALVSFSIAATFWYWTGWPQGGSATLFALLMCLFFGSIDNPVPVVRTLVKVLLFAVVLDTLYLFVILPSIHSFPTLVIAFAPVFIPLAIVASNPATFMIALLPIAMLTLQNAPMTAFEAFINGMVATILGVVVVLATTSVMKSISAEASARRLLRASWRDIAAIASHESSREDAEAFSSRMLDRLALLAPRLQASTDETMLKVEAMSDLRLGLNLMALKRCRAKLDPDARAASGRVLRGVAARFDRVAGGRVPKGDPALLADVDTALASVTRGRSAADDRLAVQALAGIRRAVFPDAPAYRGEREHREDREPVVPQAMAAE